MPARSIRRIRRAPTLLLAVAVLAASACGGDDDDASDTTADVAAATTNESTSEASATAVTSEASESAFPVAVTHAQGTTVVESAPTRVVTVGVTEQDTVLALGVIPVGVTDWYGDQPYATWPWAQDELGDATPAVLKATDGFDYEGIAKLRPDLIIGTNAGIDEAAYEKLTAIAPTIAHPADAPLYFSPWDDQARLIGQALGKEAEMTAIIDDIDAQFAAAMDEHPEFAGRKVIFLQNAFYDGRAIAYQNGLSTAFLTELGFTVPPELDAFETDGGQAYIPIEQLGVLDVADVLLWATESPTDRTALEQEPLYGTLEEVREGRLVFTDGVTAGAIYFTSPLSLPFVLEQLVPALASTIAGDGPATIDAAG